LPSQHITEETANSEAILVPLDLDELQIVSQEWLANGTIRVEVMATTTQAPCPHCQKRCVKIHDTRPRKKRDISLRGHQVELIVLKRRFRCLRCRKSGTRTRYGVWLEKEDDSALARRDRQVGLHPACRVCGQSHRSRPTLC
jgi:transposase